MQSIQIHLLFPSRSPVLKDTHRTLEPLALPGRDLRRTDIVLLRELRQALLTPQSLYNAARALNAAPWVSLGRIMRRSPRHGRYLRPTDQASHPVYPTARKSGTISHRTLADRDQPKDRAIRHNSSK